MSVYTCTYCDKDLEDERERFTHPTDHNLCCEECSKTEHTLEWTHSPEWLRMFMNDIVRECLEHILLEPAAWKAIREGKLITGYEPQMTYIQHELIEAREARFYDDVYFPHLKRLMEIVKRRDLFKGATWELRELGYAKQIMCWIPNDTECQDLVGDHMQVYMEPLWNSDQWIFEEFHVTRDDVLALGVRPGKLAAVQEKLF